MAPIILVGLIAAAVNASEYRQCLRELNEAVTASGGGHNNRLGAQIAEFEAVSTLRWSTKDSSWRMKGPVGRMAESSDAREARRRYCEQRHRRRPAASPDNLERVADLKRYLADLPIDAMTVLHVEAVLGSNIAWNDRVAVFRAFYGALDEHFGRRLPLSDLDLRMLAEYYAYGYDDIAALRRARESDTRSAVSDSLPCGAYRQWSRGSCELTPSRDSCLALIRQLHCTL